MGKIAFVFSGQGDQYPGMGKALAEQYEAAAKVYQMCDRLRPGTSAQCFEGTDEELKETKNTQPCLFAMELAAAKVLCEAGIKPDAVAGFSLGEVVACTVAGVVDEEIGFRLVCKRGELMQQAAEQYDTSMAAVVKLSQEKVEELCGGFQHVYPVNFNCPGQITVAGLSAEMPEFSAAVKAAGGRAIPLKVKGGFHSPFMRQAADAFAVELAQVTLREPVLLLYSNVTAQPYGNDVMGALSAQSDGNDVAGALRSQSNGTNIAGLLSKQICNPVRWEKIIRNMIAAGVDTFIEVGPGNTLTNMIGKIDVGVKTYNVADLATILAEVKA